MIMTFHYQELKFKIVRVRFQDETGGGGGGGCGRYSEIGTDLEMTVMIVPGLHVNKQLTTNIM